MYSFIHIHSFSHVRKKSTASQKKTKAKESLRTKQLQLSGNEFLVTVNECKTEIVISFSRRLSGAEVKILLSFEFTWYNDEINSKF